MKKARPLWASLQVWLAAIAVAVPALLLLCWCFVNRWPWPQIVPQAFTARGLQRLFSGYLNVGRVLFSSVLLSGAVGLLNTAVATMAARACVLYNFKGKKWVERLAFLPIVVPAAVFAMGSHMLFLRMGLGNTVLAVVVGHLVYTLPFAMKIMVDVTKMSDARLEQQAQLLGAGPLRAFCTGTLPVIAPGVVSSVAVVFLMSYSQYFLTLVLGGGKVKTLAIVVMPLITGSDRTISSVYSVLYILSTLLVFLVFQLVSGRLAKRVGAQLGTAVYNG